MDEGGGMNLRWYFLGLGLATIAVVVVAGRLSQDPSSPQFAGSLYADLGTVVVENEIETVEHRFSVTNQSGRVLEVERVTSSCGCLSAEAINDRIEPEGALDVVGRMALDSPGALQATIWIYFVGERSPLALTMHVEGMVPTSLQPLVEEVRFVGGDDELHFGIQFVSQDGGSPGILNVEADEGYEAHAGEWQLIPRGRKGFTRFQTRITVSRDPMTTHDGTVRLELEECDLVVTIPIRYISASK